MFDTLSLMYLLPSHLSICRILQLVANSVAWKQIAKTDLSGHLKVFCFSFQWCWKLKAWTAGGTTFYFYGLKTVCVFWELIREPISSKGEIMINKQLTTGSLNCRLWALTMQQGNPEALQGGRGLLNLSISWKKMNFKQMEVTQCQFETL